MFSSKFDIYCSKNKGEERCLVLLKFPRELTQKNLHMGKLFTKSTISQKLYKIFGKIAQGHKIAQGNEIELR